MALPNGSGSLRTLLDEHVVWGYSLKELTVLAPQNDPFRCDTPAGHRDGSWLADCTAALRQRGRRHIRGLHYALIGQPKPDGLPYANTEKDYDWLNKCAKLARWLGYIPFDEIVDERNEEPTLDYVAERQPGYPFVYSADAEINIPSAEDFRPRVGLRGFTARQPYHLTLVGEKSSLQPVLGRVARAYDADLFLPNGEISDTLLHRMASHAVEDGRPMIVLYFSDADPAGWQMPISVARKLQAFRALEYDFEFEVRRVGLTPNQVRQYDLPSTMLKEGEKRADAWVAAMGIQQTEIDSLAALQPDLLERMARDVIAPFFDDTLERRVRRAESNWRTAAQQAVEEQSDVDLEPLREQVAGQLAEKAAEIEALLSTIEVDADMFDLPDVPEVPEPELDGYPLEPLISSSWDFAEQCERLIESKRYTNGTGE
jgi:hypothetical protein